MTDSDNQYGQEEADKIENYVNTFYSVKVPPPEPPSPEDLSFWKISGFETLSFFLPSLSFAIFSAVRTAGFFFIQEKTLLEKYNLPPTMIWLLSLLVMATAIMGFEGYMLARGIKQGREQTENKVSWAGTYLTVTVIILVGIFTGIGMINISDQLKLFIDVTMVLVTGISGGIITFFGGNDIGFALKKFDLERIRLQIEFQDNFNNWRESAVRSYFAVHRKTNVSSPVPEDAPQQQKMSKLEKAYLFVSNHYSKTKSLPTNQVIADNANVSLGTAFKALAMFTVKNEEELLSSGAVKQEQVIKANTFLGQTMNKEGVPPPTDLIREFIKVNGKFPVSEQLKQMNIPLKDVVEYIVKNEDEIRSMGLLTDEVIEQAKQNQ